MKEFKFTINGNDYEVDVVNHESDIVQLEVNGTSYEVKLHKEMKAQTKTPTLVRASVPAPKRNETKIKKNLSSGGTPIKAPLPGTIMEIKVREGDTIKKGDVILIMEAMKMENNVLAETDGTITSIKVAPQDNVLQDDVLVEIA